MPAGLIDATTLISFWVAGEIRVLAEVFGDKPPCWCSAVKAEIQRGPQTQSNQISGLPWLGVTAEPEELGDVFRLRTALTKPGDPPLTHLGEAESIAIASSREIVFATDDFAAYDFAKRIMDPHLVWDSVRIIEEAIRLGVVDTAEATQVVESIRDNGRYLRPGHPDPFRAADFNVAFE